MEDHCIAFAKAVAKQRFSQNGKAAGSKQTRGGSGHTVAKGVRNRDGGDDGSEKHRLVANESSPFSKDPLLRTTISTLLTWCSQCAKGNGSAKVLLESSRALWSLSLQPTVLESMYAIQ